MGADVLVRVVGRDIRSLRQRLAFTTLQDARAEDEVPHSLHFGCIDRSDFTVLALEIVAVDQGLQRCANEIAVEG